METESPSPCSTELVDDFEIMEQVGKGGFSSVHIAKHIPTGTYVAAKIVNLSSLREAEFNGIMREISVFMQVTHPNVAFLYRLTYQDGKLYFFMEYATGGTLLNYVNNKKGLPEAETRRLVIQIFSAMRHFHVNHMFVHRDLKLENILLDGANNVKVTDFGFANTFYLNTLRTIVGTPGYTPPEVLAGNEYDEKCDVWSLGICIYAMMTAMLPFPNLSNNYRVLVEQREQLEFPPNFSPALVDLLTKMLEIRPQRRPSLIQLQSHPFFRPIDQLSLNITPHPIVFYRVSDKSLISKFRRNKTTPDPDIVQQMNQAGIDTESLAASLEDGLLNAITTTYFAYLKPLLKKPEIVINTPPLVKPNKVALRKRKLEERLINRISYGNVSMKKASPLKMGGPTIIIPPSRLGSKNPSISNLPRRLGVCL